MLALGALIQSIAFTITFAGLGIGATNWTDRNQKVPILYLQVVGIAGTVALLSWILYGWLLAFSA